MIVGVSCWGDLLHYPEYVRCHVRTDLPLLSSSLKLNCRFVSQLRPESEKVGNYARDSRSLVSSVLPLRYLKVSLKPRH